ncbi:MAG: hypothetical protein Kow00121_48510 [Elainellaceae cyanobacterium]
MAIVLSGLPVCAEEQSPERRASQNTISELNASPGSKPFENSTTASLKEVAFNKTSHHAAIEGLLATPEKPVALAQDLKQADPVLVELSVEATEPVELVESEAVEPLSLLNFVTQGDEGVTFDSAGALTGVEAVELSFPSDAIAQTEPTSPSSEASPEVEPPPTASGDRWQFSVAPYFFVPLNAEADVSVAGRRTSIDLGLGDILNLDRAFDAGLRLEAWNNRLGFILDGFYISAADSGSLGRTFSAGSVLQFVRQTSPGRLQGFVQQFDPIRLQQLGQQLGQRQLGLNTTARVTADGDVFIRQITVDLAVSYRVVDTALGNSAEETNLYPRLTIAPIVGVRTNFLRQTVDIDTIRINDIPIPDQRLPAIDREFRFSRTLVEPMIGAQIGLDLSERWALGLRGDVSGFGIGADQNLTWNLLVTTQYRLSQLASLQLGYRFNSFDFEDGEGLRRTELNLRQNGLWLGSVFRF